MFSHTPDTSSLVAAFATAELSANEAEWSQAVARERQADDLSVPEPNGDGNYDSPILNSLTDGWRRLVDGRLEDEAFLDLLQRAYQRIDEIGRVQQSCLIRGVDQPDNPIVQTLQAGLHEHRDAFDRLANAAPTRDLAMGGLALADLQLATNRIVESYGWFQKLRGEALHIQCPSCGVPTRRDVRKCPGCGLPLQPISETQPRLLAEAAEGALKTQPTVTTPNYQRVERALGSWQRGELSDTGLRDEIDAVAGNMQAHRRANQAERRDLAELSEEDQTVMVELLDAVDAALDLNLQALALMQDYFESGESDNLRDGFDRLGPATAQIVQAFVASQTLMGQTHDLEELDDEGYLEDDE